MATQPQDYPAVFTVDLAAKYMRCSHAKVRELLSNGSIRGTRLGPKGDWRVTHRAIDEFLGDA